MFKKGININVVNIVAVVITIVAVIIIIPEHPGALSM